MPKISLGCLKTRAQGFHCSEHHLTKSGASIEEPTRKSLEFCCATKDVNLQSVFSGWPSAEMNKIHGYR